MEPSLHIPGHTPFSIAAVALVATAGFLLYAWRVRGAVGRRDQAILLTLRLVAVAGILGAYVQPSLRLEERMRRRPVVAVLVDDSASMGTLAADGRTRAEEAAHFVRDHAGWFEDLEQTHDVTYWAFSDRARATDRETLSSPLPSEGGATDLLAALDTAFQGIPSRDIGGVVVVSDGIDNGALSRSLGPTGAPLAGERARLADLPGPIHGVVPGPPAVLKDVVLGRVTGLDYLLARNLADVRCEVKTLGYDGGSVTVTLSEGGEVLDQAEVAAADAARGVEVTLHVLPRSPGRHAYTVAVSPLAEEMSLANNLRTLVADVVRDRVRVLHVAGHPSWDERFLREYLKRRRDVELVSFHTLRAETSEPSASDDETTLIPFPAEQIFVERIDGFDLLVLQDYELPDTDRERYAEGLTRYVQAGGGLLVVGGSWVLGARGPWPTALDRLLPVTAPRPASRGMVEGRFPVEVPAEARKSPLVGEPRLLALLQNAQPLPAFNPVGAVEPGAQILLRTSPEGGTGRQPLLVAAPSGKGRVALVLTDALWRWSFDPGGDETYRRLLDGVLDWLSGDPSAGLLRVAAARPRTLPDRPLAVSLRAPDGTEALTLTLERQAADGGWEPEGPPRMLPPGTETAEVVPASAGPHRVAVVTTLGDARLQAADVFLAGPHPDEVTQILPTVPHLATLAALTGGKVIPATATDLSPLAVRPEVVVRVGVSADEPLWNHPLVFLLLLAVLGLEWYVERKIGYT